MSAALQFSLACFFAIFPIVNPFSAAALLIALTPGETTRRRLEQARRAVWFMTGIMLVRALTGAERLTPAQQEEGSSKMDISLTPLGMPMLAGPGTISVVIGLSADAHGVLLHAAAVAAMLAVALSSYAVLSVAPSVVRVLGQTGQAAVSKIMGLIILCVGIQFLINGFSVVAPGVVRP